MKHMLRGAAIAAMLAAVPALAEERICTGTIGAIQLDNVRVPDGRSCTLQGTILNGNIVVGRGATLVATGVRMNGNVRAEGHRLVRLDGGTDVGGSVQLTQGGRAQISGIAVDSDIQLDANLGALALAANRVGGNVQVVGNSGGVTLNRNRISGALQCKENSPAPTGSGNVAGDKERQCARL